MIYFCADDYGVSNEGNCHIEECLKNGVLNKVSVLPNGEISDFEKKLLLENKELCLHINLVEGKPLSNPDDVKSLIAENGCFKYSFIGLFFKSLLPRRKKFEKQIYNELKCQIDFWKDKTKDETGILLDSHQHTHMIPLVFKTLMRVIKDEGVSVKYIRIPAEPILPYLLAPSLYFDYSVSGLVKQWLLKILFLANKKHLKRANINYGYFMGVLLSGRMTEKKINKILPHYIKMAKKKDVEIGFHPGYMEKEELTFESRKGFKNYYSSSWRKTEYETLMNLKY